MSTHARPLADQLGAASDARLERLLRVRGVRADADWNDFFDAAEALLEQPSIERGLAALGRGQARALQHAVDHPDEPNDEHLTEELAALALTDTRGKAFDPVAALVRGRGEVADVASIPSVPSAQPAAARAAERAFTTIRALADLLLAATTMPLALVATGALSATEKRRLEDDGALDALRALAEITGLARGVDRELRVTARAQQWLGESFAARWLCVAGAFREALPAGIRCADSDLAPADWPAAYPWDPTWPDRAAQLQDLAARLGLVAEDGTTPAWAAPLRTEAPFDASALQALLPTEVDRVFLQNDLTAIAPGPLQPSLDNRLRTMTEHASAAQASTYRFTADSIARALIAGESEASMLDFLRDVSLTGVPQPLEYLVSQTAARHGLVKVGPDAAGGTTVSSADAHLLEAIEIDRNLRPIGLVREGDRLVSRVSAESVAWALADARYPATLVDDAGADVTVARTRIAPPSDEHEASYAPLIARLRSGQGPDADAAWLDRELDAAVRARAVVEVTVAMPDGSHRQLILEASGLGGGRLRGRDRAADVERTLPVRSIQSVRVLQS